MVLLEGQNHEERKDRVDVDPTRGESIRFYLSAKGGTGDKIVWSNYK